MFGRVRADKNTPDGRIELVGRTSDGALAASAIRPPDWYGDGTPEFCHWMSHRQQSRGVGTRYRVFGERLRWKWWQENRDEQWGCEAPWRRTDLPDDDTGIVKPSEVDFGNEPRIRLAGYLEDDRVTEEVESLGTCTYTWLTCGYGQPKVWLAVPPEVSLPGGRYERCVIDATAVAPETGSYKHRAVVNRLVPPDEDPAQVNKWLQAEHDHLRRIGEFCDMRGLHETWLAAARDENARKQAWQDLYDKAAALPLIVLAGLR